MLQNWPNPPARDMDEKVSYIFKKENSLIWIQFQCFKIPNCANSIVIKELHERYPHLKKY